MDSANFQCTCDNCFEPYESKAPTKKKFCKELVKNGWILKKINGIPHYFCCNECAVEYSEDHKGEENG